MSLAKAAGELRLTSSAVAQSIAVLEDRLGMKLVRGLSPVVELTRVGHGYFRAVQQFSHNLRDGFYEKIPARRTQLRITAAQAFARLWLAPRLGRFVLEHPRIDLVLTTTEQFQAIGHGGVDVGLRYGHVDNDELVSIPLWTDRMIAVGTPTLALQARGMTPARIAATMPVIEHSVASWRLWLAGVDSPSVALRPVLTCSDLHLAIEAACQGIGLAISPSRIVEGKLASEELALASGHSVAGQAYQAVVSRDQMTRVPIQQFLHWLISESQSKDDEPHPVPVNPVMP